MAFDIVLAPTDAGGTTVTYTGTNSTDDGKYSRQFDAGAMTADLIRFRVPGTDGSLIVRGGNIGHKIIMSVRYIAADIDTLEGNIQTDLDYFVAEAYNITHAGITYTGCNLVPGSVQKTTPILPTGRTAGQVFVDLTMLFNEDQP